MCWCIYGSKNEIKADKNNISINNDEFIYNSSDTYRLECETAEWNTLNPFNDKMFINIPDERAKIQLMILHCMLGTPDSAIQHDMSKFSRYSTALSFAERKNMYIDSWNEKYHYDTLRFLYSLCAATNTKLFAGLKKIAEQPLPVIWIETKKTIYGVKRRFSAGGTDQNIIYAGKNLFGRLINEYTKILRENNFAIPIFVPDSNIRLYDISVVEVFKQAFMEKQAKLVQCSLL